MWSANTPLTLQVPKSLLWSIIHVEKKHVIVKKHANCLCCTRTPLSDTSLIPHANSMLFLLSSKLSLILQIREADFFFLIQLLLLLTTNLTAKFHLFAWIAIVLTLLCTGQQALALYQVRQRCEVGLCSSYLLLGDTAAELHGRREQWILLVRDSERVQGRGVQALWEQTGSEVEDVSEAVDYRYIIDYPFTSWRWMLVVSVALAGEAAKMLTYSLFSNFPSVVSGFQCHL